MSEQQTIQQILKKAQKIRFNSKTSCVQLQNYLYYQRIKLTQNNAKNIILCGSCGTQKAVVKDSFKRAFKTMNPVEKAQFYHRNCCYVNDFLHQKTYDEESNQEQQPIIKKRVQIKQSGIFGDWIPYTIQIYPKQKVIRIVQLRDQIDLHHFLLRKSKNKNKKSFVFESTQPFSNPQTYRISTITQSSFSQLQQLIKKLTDEAHRQKIIKLLLQQKKYPSIIKNQQLKLMKSNMIINKQSATIKLISKYDKNIQKDIQIASNSNTFNQLQYKKIGDNIISKDFYTTLNNFQDYQEIKNQVFFQKKGNKVRKIFKFKQSEVKFQWLIDQLVMYKNFQKWRPSLHSISLLNKFPAQRTHIFHQINFYTNRLQIQYIYLRHYTIRDNNHYFIDKSPSSGYGPSQSNIARGQINYLVWRLRKIGNLQIEVLVEADINHSVSGNYKQLTNQFIGNYNQVINCIYGQNSFFDQNDIHIMSLDFQKDYLSQIDQDYNSEVIQTQFYSIEDKQSVRDLQLNIIEKTPILANFKQNSTRDVLDSRHPTEPTPKNKTKKRKAYQNGHFIWQDQWIIKQNGDLQNINEQKIKAQSGVLKSVIKRMGVNLLSGKSIINMSLPIQVFSKLSFTQKLCQCLTYAPIIFQDIVQYNDPVQKFKSVFGFSISCMLTYLEMSKPFNPILGQTYQGLIDGCPVYAEQISHHPPICSFFFKGRGYFIHGYRQPKVQLGLNSASGVNQGTMNVSFHPTDYNKNIITFTGITGQMRGVIFGDRTLRLVNKSLIYDKQNNLYCQVNWGKSKEKDQFANYYDYFYGKLLKVKQEFNYQSTPKKTEIVQELGIFRGRWTKKIYFNDQLIFDVDKQAPCTIEDYHPSLQSNSDKRKDIKLRRQQNFQQAQTAKQQLEQLQRYDAKLRKNHKNK